MRFHFFDLRRLQTASVSPRERRAVTIGALSIAGMLAFSHGWPALRARTELAVARASTATADVVLLRARLAHARRTTDSTRVRRTRLAEREVELVRGATPAAAAAELGAIVREIAAEADVVVGAVQVSADTAAGAPHYVLVRASTDGTGDVDALEALLDGLEAGATRLVLRELAVERTGQPIDVATGRMPLRIRIVVEGLARRAARPSTGPTSGTTRGAES